MKAIIVILLAGLVIGCQNQSSVSQRYAELRVSKSDRMQLLIKEDLWGGIATVDGVGPGWVHNLYYWSTLNGLTNKYIDPVLFRNGNQQFKHLGTITVDRKNKRVMIDLQEVVSKPGEPQWTEPSPANGTYPIKDINHDPFMTPKKGQIWVAP